MLFCGVRNTRKHQRNNVRVEDENNVICGATGLAGAAGVNTRGVRDQEVKLNYFAGGIEKKVILSSGIQYTPKVSIFSH